VLETGWPGTNTLAYYEHSYITIKKTIFGPVVKLLKGDCPQNKGATFHMCTGVF